MVDPYALSVASIEMCPRCGAAMNWIQSTWQCPRCRFKLGCCEGEPQCETQPEKQQVPRS